MTVPQASLWAFWRVNDSERRYIFTLFSFVRRKLRPYRCNGRYSRVAEGAPDTWSALARKGHKQQCDISPSTNANSDVKAPMRAEGGRNKQRCKAGFLISHVMSDKDGAPQSVSKILNERGSSALHRAAVSLFLPSCRIIRFGQNRNRTE